MIYRAIDGDPELFQTIYLDVLGKTQKQEGSVTALDADRCILGRALPSTLQAAAQLPEEAESRRAVVGDQRPLCVLAALSLAFGVRLRVAGAQRAT